MINNLTTENFVDHITAPVRVMAEDWPIAEALLGGTKAMRAAGVKFLPMFPGETNVSYAARIACATLYPAFRRTLSVMGGKPFSKAITLGDDVPDEIEEFTQNVDRENRNLTTFASDVFFECLGYGLCGILVDFPIVPDADKLSKAAEQALGVRPYFNFIRHDSILGWRFTEENGVYKLTQLRLKEGIEKEFGAYGTQVVERVRVLEVNRWELWEETPNAVNVIGQRYVMIEEGTNTLGEIPFVPFYGRRLAFMMGQSPLLDLAYLNVKHWQSQSDQDTLLHQARVPILLITGTDEKQPVVIGSGTAMRLPTGGDAKYVEHTGQAIGAGKTSLDDLQQQMIESGAELLVMKPGQRSATEANNDAEANKSDLQRMVEGMEDGLDQCIQLVAKWFKIEEAGHVQLFKDFGAANLSDASAQIIIQMQAAGYITKKTAIIEMQRRGFLSPDVDPETEIDLAELEAPDPLEMMIPPNDPNAPAPAPKPPAPAPAPGATAPKPPAPAPAKKPAR